MSWYCVKVPRPGRDLAAEVLLRAHNRDTWSFESLGGIVYWQKRADADYLFFCPKAAAVFREFIGETGGHPCLSPLNKTLFESGSCRLTLGFRSDWVPLKRPERRPNRKSALG